MLVVGTDYPAKVGLRVEKIGRGNELESVFDFDFKGGTPAGTLGTIEVVSTDGTNCTIRWDNGDIQVCGCGSNNRDIAVQGSGANSTRATPAQHDQIYIQQRADQTESATIRSKPPQDFSMSIAQRLTTIIQPRYNPSSAATLGLRIFHGQRVDFVVPGGPAHLSQMFERNDEIIAVDGMEISPDTLQDAILGDDVEGSMVTLTIRKQHTGNIFDVQLTRVSKASMQSMVDLLDTLDQIKKRHCDDLIAQDLSGRNNMPTLILVESAVSIISQIMLDRNLADGEALASAKRVIQARESEIAQLEIELSALQQKIKSMEAVGSRERARERSSQPINEPSSGRSTPALDEALRASQLANQQLSTQLNDSRTKIKHLEDKMMAMEVERDHFTQQTAMELRSKFAQDKAAVEQENLQLRKKISAFEESKRKWLEELERSQDNSSMLKQQLQKLEMEAKSSRNSENELLKSQLAAAEAQENQLRQDLKKAQQQVLMLTTQIEQGNTAMKADLEKEFVSLKGQLDTMEGDKRKQAEELDAANQQILALKIQIEKNENFFKSSQDLVQELQNCKNTLQEQAAEITSLKQREGVVSEALQAAQLHISNLESDREQRMEILDKYTSSVRDLKTELEAREETTKRLRDEITQLREEASKQELVRKDLNEQIESMRQQMSKGDSVGSSKVLVQLRSELQQAQQQVNRMAEEQQLSRAATEEARKVLIECGRLRSELKEKNDLLKEAQSLVVDQESTIAVLQANIQSNESQSAIKLKEYEDEVNRLKVMIEELKIQWQQIHEKQTKQHADAIERIKGERPSKGGVERAAPPLMLDSTPEKQRAPRLLLTPVSQSSSKPPAKSSAVTLGVKVAANHPHYVQDISELMDENGRIINNELNIGDELIQIDGVDTKAISAEEFKKLLDGDAGTLVLLQFRDLVTNQIYTIKAQRHFSVQNALFPARNPLDS